MRSDEKLTAFWNLEAGLLAKHDPTDFLQRRIASPAPGKLVILVKNLIGIKRLGHVQTNR